MLFATSCSCFSCNPGAECVAQSPAAGAKAVCAVRPNPPASSLRTSNTATAITVTFTPVTGTGTSEQAAVEAGRGSFNCLDWVALAVWLFHCLAMLAELPCSHSAAADVKYTASIANGSTTYIKTIRAPATSVTFAPGDGTVAGNLCDKTWRVTGIWANVVGNSSAMHAQPVVMPPCLPT